MRKTSHILGLFVVLFVQAASAETIFPAVEKPLQGLFVGERLTYVIRYLGIPIGKAEGWVKEIADFNGRKAYHVVVQVRSYPVIDLVYKVRDEHHSYIDVKGLHSLRYEKKLKEGRRRSEEVMVYDPLHDELQYLSRADKAVFKTRVSLPFQDQLSCGYFFRTLPLKGKRSVSIPVHADRKSWNLKVLLKETRVMKIKGIGTFTAMEAEPVIPFEGIFVKKGKIRGWISLDERRIPLKMSVEIPVLGKVAAQLEEYQPGTALT